MFYFTKEVDGPLSLEDVKGNLITIEELQINLLIPALLQTCTKFLQPVVHISTVVDKSIVNADY